jgi:hypothetical protein
VGQNKHKRQDQDPFYALVSSSATHCTPIRSLACSFLVWLKLVCQMWSQRVARHLVFRQALSLALSTSTSIDSYFAFSCFPDHSADDRAFEHSQLGSSLQFVSHWGFIASLDAFQVLPQRRGRAKAHRVRDPSRVEELKAIGGRCCPMRFIRRFASARSRAWRDCGRGRGRCPVVQPRHDRNPLALRQEDPKPQTLIPTLGTAPSLVGQGQKRAVQCNVPGRDLTMGVVVVSRRER